jgi:hypothetical protein
MSQRGCGKVRDRAEELKIRRKCLVCSRIPPRREFSPRALHSENAVTRRRRYEIDRGPSTALAFVSRTPTPLRMTVLWIDSLFMPRRTGVSVLGGRRFAPLTGEAPVSPLRLDLEHSATAERALIRAALGGGAVEVASGVHEQVAGIGIYSVGPAAEIMQDVLGPTAAGGG